MKRRGPRFGVTWWATAGLVGGVLVGGVITTALVTENPTEAAAAEARGGLELAVLVPPLAVAWSGDPDARLSRDSAYLMLSHSLQRQAAYRAGRPRLTRYLVTQGDTLWGIAEEFGTDVGTLLALNPDAGQGYLHPGDALHIARNFRGVAHEAIDGDTVNRIATAYEIEADRIRLFNRLPGDARLSAGQLVFVPGARPRHQIASRNESTRRSSAAEAEKVRSEWIWPIRNGLMFSGFGWREDGFHRGLDIAAPQGTPVMAVQGGIVTFAGWNGGYGYCVVIDHGGGLHTLYAHASRILVEQGQEVAQGQRVILVGSTGKSTGPHLHLEVLVGGTPRNPRPYLP